MGFWELALAVAAGVVVGKIAYELIAGFLSGLFRK